MSEQNFPKCEACGLHGGVVVFITVRTTNGGLRLCAQCLADINRKNPQVKELQAQVEQLTKDKERLLEDMRRIKANCFSAFAGDSHRGPRPFVECIERIAVAAIDKTKRGSDDE